MIVFYHGGRGNSMLLHETKRTDSYVFLPDKLTEAPKRYNITETEVLL